MNSNDNSDPSERISPAVREIEMAVLGDDAARPKTTGSLLLARLTDKHSTTLCIKMLFSEITVFSGKTALSISSR